MKSSLIKWCFQIKPLDKSSPEVKKLLPLWKAEVLADGRYGIFLSARELKAQDDCGDEEITFSIVRPPFFGYLENIATGQDEFVYISVCAISEFEDDFLFSYRTVCVTAFLSDGA